ncbi:hypothetical protein ACFQMM_03120 [Saliphagus sp. GCM10025308]
MPADTPSDDYPLHPERIHGQPSSAAERQRRRDYLEELRPLLAPQADEYGSDPRLSHRDDSWLAWQERTGELPPDFERLPALAELPDPLVQYGLGGERQAEVTTSEEWEQQRERYKHQLEYWLYGRMPPRRETFGRANSTLER